MPARWFAPEWQKSASLDETGVRIIRTAEDEQVVSLERVCEPEDDENESLDALENAETAETSTEE